MDNNKKVICYPAAGSAGAGKGKREQLRVAAYARVSSDHEEQEGSFESQVAHFKEYISSHGGWQLVEVYADQGITAMNLKNRDEFNRMVDDALRGKIDIILTKSLSRFARNTIDALTTIRNLQAKNVAVIFEKENINTLEASGEFLITILASLAQQESLSLSQNVTIGLSYKYQRGEYSFNYKQFIGYDMNAAHELVVVPEQAKVVRRIFSGFISGRTEGEIAREFNDEGIPTATGKGRWKPMTVNRMLKNEKYVGDVLIQKTCTTDVLNKTREKNDGYAPQYYIRDDHEAIISRADFLLTQAELARRHYYYANSDGRCIKKEAYPFSGKIICGTCGERYIRSSMLERAGTRKYFWKCGKRIKYGTAACSNINIPEAELEEIALKAVSELFENRDERLKMIENYIDSIDGNISFDELDSRLEAYRMEHAKLLAANAKPAELKANEDSREEMLVKFADAHISAAEANKALNRLREEPLPNSYSPWMMTDLVRAVIVFHDRFEVNFYGGIVISVEKDYERWPVQKIRQPKKQA